MKISDLTINRKDKGLSQTASESTRISILARAVDCKKSCSAWIFYMHEDIYMSKLTHVAFLCHCRCVKRRTVMKTYSL